MTRSIVRRPIAQVARTRTGGVQPTGQLPLLPPVPTTPKNVTVVSSQNMQDAWTWIVGEINVRPNQPTGVCVFDRKLWGRGQSSTPLEKSNRALTSVAYLYLISELGTPSMIYDLVNSSLTQNIILPAGTLDADVRKVVEKEARFRHSLSEHLAFWVRLGTEARVAAQTRFMQSLPNVQAEDHGPDGLFLVLGNQPKIEIQSVKNSIKTPQPIIASAPFRKYGKAKEGKQLDDFWRKANGNFGLIRLGKLLTEVSGPLAFSPQQEIRLALLANCAFNAVVIADDSYAHADLFVGYEWVTNDIMKRIATYIGATNWREFANTTRKLVIQILKQARIW